MIKNLSGFERRLCDIQGRLFERSLLMNLDSPDFIGKFMTSKTCEFFDLPYDRLQWAGEEYIMDNLLDEVMVKPAGVKFGKEELFWIGYIYRYWHYLENENSSRIYQQAPSQLMQDCYPGFHTLDIAMAIDDLKEIQRQTSA